MTSSSDENKCWCSCQVKSKKDVNILEKIDEYVENFTVHGLTKVFKGTRTESLFWLLMLLGGIMLSIVIIHGLVSKYLKFGIFTEIRLQVTDKNRFPSITFCERSLLFDSYFAYCGASNNTLDNLPCKAKYRDKQRQYKISREVESPGFWFNGMFNVTRCTSWGRKTCKNKKHLRSLNHFQGSCFTWNYDGELHDIYSHFEIDFKFSSKKVVKNEPEIIAIPHDPEVTELDITNKVDIEPYKQYEIKIDKTLIKRLSSPFPSNCTSEKTGDIFPGKYTRRACIESYNYIEMYKTCGDTIDYIRQYIPEHIKKKYQKNITINEALSCIHTFADIETKGIKQCAFPCEDLDLGIVSTFHERNVKQKGPAIYRISIQYQRVDSYKVMEEKELYSWDQMACEIGGFIGLVIGASIISVVEIFAYVFLLILRKFR